MGNIIVGIVVIAIAALAGRSIYKDKKASKSSCGGGCSGCGGSCH